MVNIMFVILIAVFISSQVHAARNLAEPECGCSSDLRLIIHLWTMSLQKRMTLTN